MYEPDLWLPMAKCRLTDLRSARTGDAMSDKDKTKEQLIEELALLRRRNKKTVDSNGSTNRVGEQCHYVLQNRDFRAFRPLNPVCRILSLALEATNL